MKQNGSFQETIARIGQKLRSSRKRYFGVLLILLGIVLGIVSRAVGGSPFQDFATGILMGLSAGVLLVGILAVLLSFILQIRNDFLHLSASTIYHTFC